jgi:hypothetical protein
MQDSGIHRDVTCLAHRMLDVSVNENQTYVGVSGWTQSLRQLTMEAGRAVGLWSGFLDHIRLPQQDSKPLPIDLNLSAW